MVPRPSGGVGSGGGSKVPQVPSSSDTEVHLTFANVVFRREQTHLKLSPLGIDCESTLGRGSIVSGHQRPGRAHSHEDLPDTVELNTFFTVFSVSVCERLR